MEPTKEQIQTWIDALRSGKYKQTRGTLQDDDGHCCLGVACELFAPNYDRDADGHLRGGMPKAVYGAPLWLAVIRSRFCARTGKGLDSLNDKLRLTFEEIADVLQAVYIEEVLA